MNTKNTILAIIIIIITFVITFKGTSWYYSKQNEEVKTELRKLQIKNSELIEIREGLYTKLVADTLTIRELNKLNDSLNLELKDPKEVVVVKWKYKESISPIDNVEVTDSIVKITDYYPNKEDRFITYSGEVNKNTESGVGNFKFETQELKLGIGQNKDGTYSVNTGVPEYLKITDIDVRSLPIEKVKSDDFGWLLGASIGKDLKDAENYLKVSAGIRYKKIYLKAGAGSNGTTEVGIDIEL